MASKGLTSEACKRAHVWGVIGTAAQRQATERATLEEMLAAAHAHYTSFMQE